MKKLKLNLEDIKIESFQTSEVKIEKGTVQANASGSHIHCHDCEETFAGTCLGTCVWQDPTCDPTSPCQVSCNLTCFNTCGC